MHRNAETEAAGSRELFEISRHDSKLYPPLGREGPHPVKQCGVYALSMSRQRVRSTVHSIPVRVTRSRTRDFNKRRLKKFFVIRLMSASENAQRMRSEAKATIRLRDVEFGAIATEDDLPNSQTRVIKLGLRFVDR